MSDKNQKNKELDKKEKDNLNTEPCSCDENCDCNNKENCNEEQTCCADNMSAQLAEIKEKAEKLSKEYLLAVADFDNYRKRTLKEKADLLKYGSEECMKKLIPIIDDFERGIQAVNESTDIEAVKKGINLIYHKFQSFLDQNGVKAVCTENEIFDTERHEAVTTFPAPTPEQKGKIIDCVQKGYTLNDKVIRFAKVVVGE